MEFFTNFLTLLGQDDSAEPDAMSTVFEWVGNSIYAVLGLTALWGIYCVVIVWRRVASKRFNSEQEQEEFIEQVEDRLSQKDFESIEQSCHGDKRAMVQLVYMAVANRQLGFANVRQLIVDRFQRDVMSDLENRTSWITTVIKSAPMIGLLGTVIGMMGAFGQLAGSDNVEAKALAGNIMVALITTASGLTIAIPLVVALAMINIRIRKMEDLVGAGLQRVLGGLRTNLSD